MARLPAPTQEAERYASATIQRAAVCEQMRRAGVDADGNPTGPLAQLFDKQLEVVRHPARFKVLECGGRGGKTSTAVYDIADGMLTVPGSQNVYIALTRESAEKIFWGPFCAANEKHGWGFKANHSKLTARHRNGSWVLCGGADDKRTLERYRGIPWRKARFDECGAQRPSYLRYLFYEIVQPRLMDQNGDVWFMGTPTPQAFGLFYDACHGRVPGFKKFHWTARDNPHVDYERFVHDPETGILALNGWNEDNPIFQREYLALWTVESERLVYRLLRERNVVHALPALGHRDAWLRVLSLDFGVAHATAWSVLAWARSLSTDVYVEHAGKVYGKAPSEVADMIKRMQADYKPVITIGDVGGLGKAFARELEHRHGIVLKPADKAGRRAGIEIVSDSLFTGRLKSLAANEGLLHEWGSLLWDEKREDVQDGQEDDESDAAMYGFRETPAYKKRVKTPTEAEREKLPAHVQRDAKQDEESPRESRRRHNQRNYQETTDE